MHSIMCYLGMSCIMGEATCLHLCPCRYSKNMLMMWLRVQVKRVAVLVSKMSHCLYDLLIRHRSGEANTKTR